MDIYFENLIIIKLYILYVFNIYDGENFRPLLERDN